MAQGNPIEYSDIISPEVQKHLDELVDTVKKLTGEIEAMKKIMASGDGNFNENLKDTVEITEDLIRLEKQEIDLRYKLSKAHKKELGERAQLKEELSQTNRWARLNAKLLLAEKGSMEEMSLTLGKMRWEYRQLNKAQREDLAVGGKRLKQIQKLDKEIKAMDRSLGNHQRNVGNYPKVWQKAQSLVLGYAAAIVAAVVSIGKAVLDSNDTISSSVDFVGNKFKFGLSKMLKDLTGELASTQSGFTKWATAMEMAGSAAGAGGMLAGFLFGEAGESGKAAAQIRALESQYVTIQAQAIELQAENKAAIEASKKVAEDRNIPLEAREKYARYAVELEEQSLAKVNQAAEIQLAIAKIFHEQVGNGATKLALAEAQAQVNLNEAATITRQIELNNRVNALIKEQTDFKDQERKKQLDHELQLSLMQSGAFDDPIKQSEAELRAYSIYYSGLTNMLETARSKTNEGSTAWNVYTAQLEEVYKALDKVQLGLNLTTNATATTTAETAVAGEQSEITTAQIVRGVQQTANVAIGAAEQNKSLQYAQALINTFAAVGIALATPGNIYTNLVTAAVALATGLANVSQISNTPAYAEGIDELPSDQLANVHKGERIIPAAINRQMNGLSNAELPQIIEMGLKMPQLNAHIGQMVNQQQNTNKLLKQFAYVDASGRVHYLDGNVRNYV